jgi:hypothetical protein
MNARLNFNDSALVQLTQDMSAFLTTYWPGYPADGPPVLFGWRARQKMITDPQGGANRIIVVPGTLEGDDGDPVGIVGPGEFEENAGAAPNNYSARGLYTQPKIVTFCLWAGDTSTPDAAFDELAQQNAIEQMQEFVYRATKASNAGGANLQWTKHRYNRKPAELRFGTEYQMIAQVDSTYFDVSARVVVPEFAVVNKNPDS